MAFALIALVAGASPVARAERVHDLSWKLLHGKRAETRIAAAISLARLRDPRSLRPLVRALRDPSATVRALAATALGALRDPAALPALERARRDPSLLVRSRVAAAVVSLRTQPSVRPSAPEPTATPAHRPIYVMLKSASDGSSDRAGRALRKKRAVRMRSLMIDQFERSQDVTLVSSSSDAPIRVDPYALDLIMRKLAQIERGAHVEVVCEIRVAVSTREGKMLSVLTGGAKVQVPKAMFRDELLPELRHEALEGAVRSVHRDLVAYLVKLP